MKLTRSAIFSKYFLKVFICLALLSIYLFVKPIIIEHDEDDIELVMPMQQKRGVRFYVNTSRCHIPQVDPFGEDVMKIFNPTAYRNCASDEDYVRSIFDSGGQQYRLVLSQKLSETQLNVTCCYRRVQRMGKLNEYLADNYVTLDYCVDFEQNFTVPKHISAMIVYCKSKEKVIQKLGFAFVQKKPISKSIKARKAPQSLPSVLIFGIDSLSRINFRRNMPETHAYFTKNRWFELQGYTKMGDNTYPNVMALLTGLNERDAYDVCQPEQVGGLDNCTFIWKNFKARGYRTAFGEDAASISTFNLEKRGFLREPTDHYLRPFILAISENLPTTKDNKNICVGRKHYAEYVLDYAYDFIRAYRGAPIFGLFWLNSFSHNHFDGSSGMDARFLAYLRRFEDEGVFKQSIVLFVSDHGMRYGPLRQLSSGFLESRSPVFYMSLPEWFQRSHVDFIAALYVNRNRLTSPYDIHNTLLHILALDTRERQSWFPHSRGCPACQSIFYMAAEDRSCEAAGIGDHWCACEAFMSVSVDSKAVHRIATLIVTDINKYLIDNDYKDQCSKLALHSVLSAERNENLGRNSHILYRLKFLAEPLYPIFEATLIYHLREKKTELDIESISRLNSYEHIADCVSESTVKKFCICKVLAYV